MRHGYYTTLHFLTHKTQEVTPLSKNSSLTALLLLERYKSQLDFKAVISQKKRIAPASRRKRHVYPGCRDGCVSVEQEDMRNLTIVVRPFGFALHFLPRRRGVIQPRSIDRKSVV